MSFITESKGLFILKGSWETNPLDFESIHSFSMQQQKGLQCSAKGEKRDEKDGDVHCSTIWSQLSLRKKKQKAYMALLDATSRWISACV